MTLDPDVRDQLGLPVARIFHVDHANDGAMRRRAWQAARSLYEAAGARSIHTRGPFAATHNMGTCSQSANPRDGVCGTYGQTHDVGNLFISDGSQFCIEEPALIAKILGHVQQRPESDNQPARAPPGHQGQGFNLM